MRQNRSPQENRYLGDSCLDGDWGKGSGSWVHFFPRSFEVVSGCCVVMGGFCLVFKRYGLLVPIYNAFSRPETRL